MLGGEQHGGGDRAVAEERQAHVGAHDGRRGERRQFHAVEGRPLRARLGERGRAHDDRAATGRDGVDARLVGERHESAGGRPPPDVQHGGVVDRVGQEHDAGTVDGLDGAHLQVGWRHRLAVDEQPAGTVAVGAGDERAVGRQSRQRRARARPIGRRCPPSAARWTRWPGRPRAPRRPAGRVVCTVMISPSLGPVHVDQVREPGAVPLDVDDRAVEGDEVQRDVGVGRARGRVGKLGRRRLRLRRIADVPRVTGAVSTRATAMTVPSGFHQ